jgi:large repetitive protein
MRIVYCVQLPGVYGVGEVIDIDVTFNSAVAVSAPATTTIALSTGGTAVYISSSAGSTVLKFRYIVSITNTAGPVLVLPDASGTIAISTVSTDTLNTASLTLPSDTNTHLTSLNINVDASQPRVTAVTCIHRAGVVGVGEVIPVSVTFSAPVVVTGVPTLLLDLGDTDVNAVYLSGSGTSILVFRYTVGVGESTSDLDYTDPLALDVVIAGATIKRAATTPTQNANLLLSDSLLGQSCDIAVDTRVPAVASISTLMTPGVHGVAGTLQTIEVVWDVGTVLSSGAFALTIGDLGTTACVSATSGTIGADIKAAIQALNTGIVVAVTTTAAVMANSARYEVSNTAMLYLHSIVYRAYV